MAYNNKNKLKRVKEVQDLYRQHWKDGVTSVYVYNTFIYPRFHISPRTFNEYLGINVAQEQKEIELKAGKQTDLFNDDTNNDQHTDAGHDQLPL